MIFIGRHGTAPVAGQGATADTPPDRDLVAFESGTFVVTVGKDPNAMIADLAMQRALDRLESVGFERLSEEDKTLATIWYFESRVANGGFAHFFKSAEGYLAPHAPVAFRAIGADALAGIAEEANAVFGPAGVPRSKKDRADALRSRSADAHRIFAQLEDRYFETAPDLEDQLEAYLASHPSLSQ